MFADTNAFSSFAVDDLDAARAFYEKTLGLRVSVDEEQGGLLTLHQAGGKDTIIYFKPDFVPATYTILNFSVADIDVAVDELIARGVLIERYPGFDHDEKGIVRDKPSIAWFRDPAGNILAVLTEM